MDLPQYLRTCEDALGINHSMDALANSAPAFLAGEQQSQYDLAHVLRGPGEADFAATLRISTDIACGYRQAETVSESVARMVAQTSTIGDQAEILNASLARGRAEAERRYNVTDVVRASLAGMTETYGGNDARHLIEMATEHRYDMSDLGGVFRTADLVDKFGALNIVGVSRAESDARTQYQALQNSMQLAMPDTTAFRQDLLANIPMGIETTFASMRAMFTGLNPNVDPFAAYGPFVHIRPEPPRWDSWSDRVRNDSWEEVDESDDDFERTDSGIYVRKRGRPPGITDFTETEFMGAIIEYWRCNDRFPTMQAIADHIHRSLKTVKRYCKRWGIDWYELRFTLRVD